MLIDRENLQEELLGTIGRLRDELDNMHNQLDDIAKVASAPLALAIAYCIANITGSYLQNLTRKAYKDNIGKFQFNHS